LEYFVTGTDSTLRQRVSQTLALSGGRRSARSPDAESAVQFYPHLGILLGDVRPDGVERLRHEGTVRTIGHALSLPLIRPTDPVAAAAPRNSTWGIEAIEVERLWNAATPIRGAGILLAHLDTGVDVKHPTLAGAIAGTLVTDANGFAIPNAPMEDLYGHGTHTAATIAGRSVAGRYVGIAPEAKLYSATVIEGGLVVSRILRGLDWAVANRVHIVNLSLGLSGYHDDFYPLIGQLLARGILVVAAVGNEGPGTSRSPGNYENVLSVGACDEQRLVWGDSSSDSFITPIAHTVPNLVAPGVAVVSAHPGGGYASMSGSSMATPHVAGLAALLWSARPQAAASEIVNAIRGSCTLAPGMPANRAGLGMPNAPNAFNLLTGSPVIAGKVSLRAGRASHRKPPPKRKAKKATRAKRAKKRSPRR
jgi:subtilisin